MKPGVPWSVKGVEPDARAVAKLAARKSGMTLGQWLNHVIREVGSQEAGLDDETADSDTSQIQQLNALLESGLDSATGGRRAERSPRSDSEINAVHAALSDMVKRFENAQQKSSLILDNLDNTISGVAARLEAVEDSAPDRSSGEDPFAIVHAMQVELLDRIKRLEAGGNSSSSNMSLKPIEEALSKVATHIERNEKHALEGLQAMQSAISRLVDRLNADQSDKAQTAKTVELAIERLSTQLQHRDELYQRDQDTLDRSLDSVRERVAKIEEEARDASESIREKLYDLSATLENAASAPFKGDETGTGPVDTGRLDSLESEIRDLGRKLDDADERFNGAINTLGGELVAIRVHLDQARADSAKDDQQAPEPPDAQLPPDPPEEEKLVAKQADPPAAKPKQAYFSGDDENAQDESDDSRLILKEVLVPNKNQPSKQENSAKSGESSVDQSNEDKETDANALVTLFRGVAREARASVKGFEKGDKRENVLDVDDEQGAWRQTFVTAGFLFAFFLTMTLGAIFLLNGETEIPGLGRPDVVSSLNEAADTARRGVLSLFGGSDETAEDVSTEAIPGTGSDSSISGIAPAESFAVDVSIDDAIEADTGDLDASTSTTFEPSATRPLTSDSTSEGSAVTSFDSIGTLTRAALAGDTYAQYLLGGRYLNGDGVELDSARGALLVQQAATTGLPSAQYRLGTLFERGEGVPRDPLNAVKWYEKAAVAGEVKAMHNLAVLHAEGSGIPQDFSIASRWFEVAAERGLADSQFNLGILRQKGLGISKDMVEAYKWFALAARDGDQEAERQRLAVESQLPPSGLTEGRDLVDRWEPLSLTTAPIPIESE